MAPRNGFLLVCVVAFTGGDSMSAFARISRTSAKPRTTRFLQSSIFDDGRFSRHEDNMVEVQVGEDSGSTEIGGEVLPVVEPPTPSPTPIPVVRQEEGQGVGVGGDPPEEDPPEEDPFDLELALIRHQDDPLDEEGEVRDTNPMERHSDDPNEKNVEGDFADPPSIFPSQVPSLLPSVMPSGIPSVSDPPSLGPSMGPSTVPSPGAGSQPPSTVPSLMSSNPSQVPTMSPSVMPSMAPSVDCSSDASGFFGVESANSTVVTYSYEIEVTPTTNLADVFGALENAISDSVLQSLFARCNATATARKLMSRRRLEVVGMSPLPDEVPTSESCSVALANDNNACNVTEGGLTLYLDAPENGEKATTLAVIKEQMNSGAYNNVAPGIVRVTFLDRPTNPTSGGNEPAPRSNSNSGLPIWAYVLIAVSACFLIAVAVFAYRRRRRRGFDDDESLQGDPQPVDEDYQPPDTISALTSP